MPYLGMLANPADNPDVLAGFDPRDSDNSWVAEIIRCENCRIIMGPSMISGKVCKYCSGEIPVRFI